MENTNTPLTNATALALAITHIPEDNVELIEKLTHMFEVATKPATKTESAASKAAKEFAEDVFSWLHEGADGTPVTNAEIALAMGATGQKVSAALRRLIKEGSVERISAEIKSGKDTFLLTCG